MGETTCQSNKQVGNFKKAKKSLVKLGIRWLELILTMSRWFLLLGLAFGACECLGATIQEVFIPPGTKGIPVETPNYPDSPPLHFENVWKLKTSPGAHIRLWCNDVRFHEQLPCDENGMMIREGGKEEKVCGYPYDLERITKGEEIEVRVWGKNYPFSFVNCRAQAQRKGTPFVEEEGEVMPAAPPGPTTLPPYQLIPSEEIDSSEYGGPPGRKGTTCPCGTANKDGGQRIYGGSETKPNEFPFFVGLSEQISIYSICGASIITPYHALTAAHCTRPKLIEEKALCILVAVHNHIRYNESSTYYKVNIKEVIEHEDYSKQKKVNDIALLVLEEKVIFNRFTMPVCLPWKKINLDNKTIKNMGWGLTSPDMHEMNDVVKAIYARVLPYQECQKVWSSLMKEEEPIKMCTWSRNATACQGDSGGPLVWLDPETNRYTLVGMNAFGSATCGSKTPGVATKVDAFMPWILRHIQNTIPQPVCTRRD